MKRLSIASLAARVPNTVNGVGLVLFVEQLTGSTAAAGVATGLFTLSWGASSPLQGRLIDHLGPRRVLPWLAICQAAGLLALIVLGLSGVPEVALFALCFVAGWGQAPWGDVVRSVLPTLIAEPLVPAAFALDAALMELLWIAGPLATGVTTAILSPQVALLGASACALTGAAFFVTSPALRGWQSEQRQDRHPLGALRSPGVRIIVLAIFPAGVSCGVLELAVTQFAKDAGQIGATGALIAAWSASSALAGFTLGLRAWSWSLPGQWLAMLLLLTLTSAPLLLASSVAGMAALVFVAGAWLAPLIALTSQLLGRQAPPGMRTEAFSWGPTSLIIGAAMGTLLGGYLAEHQGWQWAIVACVATAAIGTAVARLGRSRLI